MVGYAGVVLGQDALEVWVVDLDAAHGLVDGLADVGLLRQVEQRFEPGVFGQVQRSSGLVVLGPGRPARGPSPHCRGGLSEPLVRIPQEDQAQYGSGILGRLQTRVGAKLVRGLPELALQFTKIRRHAGSFP